MKRLIYLLFFCALAGCSSNKTAEFSDEHLTVQVIEVKHNLSPTFKVRIYTNPKIQIDKQLLNKMYYGLDSCFYFVTKNHKYYAESIMPIANGMSGNFEYLITFGNDDHSLSEIFYLDKYINQKEYRLLIK